VGEVVDIDQGIEVELWVAQVGRVVVSSPVAGKGGEYMVPVVTGEVAGMVLVHPGQAGRELVQVVLEKGSLPGLHKFLAGQALDSAGAI
jgi:hypothetical protein